MTHIRCVAHELHNICEYLMVSYKDVNRLISCSKKIFLKAPTRVDLFRKTCPSVPLPPEPVKTRWGSWLYGIEYMCKYFDEFNRVIDILNPLDSIYIKETKELMSKSNLKTDLIFIYSHFNCISLAIKKLEKKNLSLNESLDIISDVTTSLAQSLSSNNPIITKMKSIFDKNYELKRLRNINDIMNGISEDVNIGFTPYEITCFKWCPITNSEVERSFSTYKWILTDNRLRFEEKNLRKYLIIHYNTENIDLNE